MWCSRVNGACRLAKFLPAEFLIIATNSETSQLMPSWSLYPGKIFLKCLGEKKKPQQISILVYYVKYLPILALVTLKSVQLRLLVHRMGNLLFFSIHYSSVSNVSNSYSIKATFVLPKHVVRSEVSGENKEGGSRSLDYVGGHARPLYIGLVWAYPIHAWLISIKLNSVFYTIIIQLNQVI